MKFTKNYYLFMFFLMMLTVSVKSQQIVFEEGFGNVKGFSISENQGFADLSYGPGTPKEFIISDLDLSEGVSFISFIYKQNFSDENTGGLKVYYKTVTEDRWMLLASFKHSADDWTAAKLFLPSSPEKSFVMFSGWGTGINKLCLDDIKVFKYKNASAFSDNHKVYIDTLYNFSSSYLEVNLSEDQIAGLPQINRTYVTPGVPVVCPANSVMENEPDCYVNYKDTTNQGCDTVPNHYTELYGCNGVVCSKSGTYTYLGSDKRDNDWYHFVGTGTSAFSLKVVADFKVRVYMIKITGGCLGLWSYPGFVNSTNAGDTAIINVTSVSYSSNLFIWITPVAGQTVPCGTNYVMIYKTVPVATPATPVPALNPTCAPTQLNTVTNPTNYMNYWQGTSCGLSTANPATTVYPVTSAGTYFVRSVYTPLGCWTPCSSVNVTFSPPPTVTATALPTTVCPGGQSALTGHNATSYTWMPGNLTGSTVNVSPTLPTTIYTVTGTKLGCTGTSTVSVAVVTCTGITENKGMENITVGPVPFYDELMIDCKQPEDIQVSLFTVENKRLSVQEYKGESSYIMKTGNLAAAVYFLRIESAKGSKTFKIVKQ
jgi:hypothetical protein